jgi:D-sedoheptulose 7-phosphate isomerase
MSNIELINNFFNETKVTIDKTSVKEIDKIIEVLFNAWKNDKQVFIMGNGGSASTATHFASDLSKFVSFEDKKRFKAFSLVENTAFITAIINDNGWDNLFYEQLRTHLKEGDVVIGISVHGGSGKDKAGLWSQNLTKAIAYAKEKNAKTIGLTGFDGGAMKDLCDYCVNVPVNSTPQVEGLHVVLHHLICDCLREKIKSFDNYDKL